MSATGPWSRGWPAPAKLNLFLHITGRRADGYHDLQTVFQLLDHGDRLDFRIRADARILRCGELPSVSVEQDLTLRAARALQERTGTGLGAEIHLHKRLPLSGGLGGGSSDAATALVALNRLWGCGLEPERLMALGLSLGADVPVFVQGHTAWGEGLGERLAPIELPQRWYLVLRPPVAVSTAVLFADPRLTRDCAPITIDDFLSGAGRNVFEPLVRARYPQVAHALDWLSTMGLQAGERARLTGTGACVFLGLDGREQATSILQRLPRGWEGFVARGVRRSPLLDRQATDRVSGP
jgi:4-diphosphocytidyl-2-C-methyl-D-erythritol kinase